MRSVYMLKQTISPACHSQPNTQPPPTTSRSRIPAPHPLQKQTIGSQSKPLAQSLDPFPAQGILHALSSPYKHQSFSGHAASAVPSRLGTVLYARVCHTTRCGATACQKADCVGELRCARSVGLRLSVRRGRVGVV